MTQRVAFVAGGAGGIGGAICERFARLGTMVVVADYSARRGTIIAEQICDTGGQAQFVKLDAGDEQSWQEAVAASPERIDYLVTSFFSGAAGSVEEMSAHGWDTCFRVTAAGVFLGMRAVVGKMGRGSAIVNIASLAAHTASPQNIGYSAAKAAVLNLSRSVALDLAPRGIRVNVVTPGMIRTRALEATIAALAERGETLVGDKVPLGGVGEPDDIAQAVTFLCSDGAKYITGAEFVVDGGMGLVAA